MKTNPKEVKALFFVPVFGGIILSIIGFLTKDYHSAFATALIAAAMGATFWAQGSFDQMEDKR